MTPEIRAQVVESRRRQGLPDTIEDPVVLSRIAAILLDKPTIPGAGSERGQRPTGCSVPASHAPGRGTEPAPVTLASPNDDQPDDPWSPPGEPPTPGSPDPWVPNPTGPTFLSLFTGVGGLDLGLERAGWSCVGQVEIDPYRRQVLAFHWPEVPRHEDVATVIPWLEQRQAPTPDLICGGFPCQDVSDAGPRTGVEGVKSGLWAHFAAAVRHLRPRWVLVENTTGLLARGMDRVVTDLAASGYDAEWDCLPAAAVGAPHLRTRLFLLAYPRGDRDQAGQSDPVLAGRLQPDLRAWWDTEPDVGRVVHGFPAGLDKGLSALGDAVVPQVAEHVGRLILQAHLSTQIPGAAATPDTPMRVTAGMSPRRDRAAPDSPGPAAALGSRDRLAPGVALQRKSRSGGRASSTTHEARAETRAVGAKVQPVTLSEAEANRIRGRGSGEAIQHSTSASDLPRPVTGGSWSTTTSSFGCLTPADGSPPSRSLGVCFERP